MNLFDLNVFLKNVSLYTIPVLFALTMREVAHGWAAKLLGDRTAELLGRLSLNPFKHLDLLGTVLVPGALMTLTPVPMFGWARPVPVATGALKHPRMATFAVAAAGVLANLLMALMWVAVLAIVVHVPQRTGPRWIVFMAQAGIHSNVYLGYLNLLPIPPLDGGRALLSLLPNTTATLIQKFEL